MDGGLTVIFQVKIYDRDGNVKKVISANELKRAHWEKFDFDKKRYLLPEKSSFDSLKCSGISKSKFKLSGSW